MRLLGRLRLSRDRDSSTSIERQREAIERYAELHGHRVVAWAVDIDLSRTVHPLRAPELSPWLVNPEKRERYDGIAVWRLDRIGAGSVILSWFIQWCSEHGKDLISVTESLDFGSWVGRMVGSVIAGVAEGEVEGTRERVLSSQEKLRRTGRWHGGAPPYGYRVERRSSGHYLAINPDEAGIVRDIFGKIISGYSASAVANDLASRGISARRGGKWTATSVRRLIFGRWVLGQRVHSGRVVLDETGTPVFFASPIIAEDDWLKAQAALNDRSRPKRRTNPPGVLLDILYCYRCGEPMYLTVQSFRDNRGQRTYRYWRCSGRVLRKSCDAPSVRAEVIEEFVSEWLVEDFGNKEVTEPYYVPGSDNSEELTRVERSIAGIRKERDLGLYDDDDDGYLSRISALVDRKKLLESQPQTKGRWERSGTGKTYAELWPTLSNEDKRDLLAKSGVKVWVQGKPWIARVRSDIDKMTAMIPAYAPPTWLTDQPADEAVPSPHDSQPTEENG